MKYILFLICLIGGNRFLKAQNTYFKSPFQPYSIGTITKDTSWILLQDIFAQRQSKIDSIVSAENLFEQNGMFFKPDSTCFEGDIGNYIYVKTNGWSIVNMQVDTFKEGDTQFRNIPHHHDPEHVVNGVPCNCHLYKDTLELSTIIGFFGGSGLVMQVVEGKYNVGHFEWVESEYKNFKSEPEGSFESTSFVEGKSTLEFVESPQFNKKSQTIWGKIRFVSNPYLEANAIPNKIPRDDEAIKKVIFLEAYFYCKPVRVCFEILV
jgi:hypothetical protein